MWNEWCPLSLISVWSCFFSVWLTIFEVKTYLYYRKSSNFLQMYPWASLRSPSKDDAWCNRHLQSRSAALIWILGSLAASPSSFRHCISPYYVSSHLVQVQTTSNVTDVSSYPLDAQCYKRRGIWSAWNQLRLWSYVFSVVLLSRIPLQTDSILLNQWFWRWRM